MRYAADLPPETVVDIKGIVKLAPSPIQSATQVGKVWWSAVEHPSSNPLLMWPGLVEIVVFMHVHECTLNVVPQTSGVSGMLINSTFVFVFSSNASAVACGVAYRGGSCH